MPEQEEKRIIVKVAYNYFQSGKWDRALEEYKKLLDIDPMDFLVYNMMAEIYIRKGEKERAVSEYLKAASLLRATNNIEKAIHAYNHALKVDPDNSEAKAKIEEAVRFRIGEVDDLISRGALKNAYDLCDRLANKVPEHPMVKEKLDHIERLEDEAKNPAVKEPAVPTAAVSKDDNLNKDVVVNNLLAMADRYEKKQAWDEAVEAYITVLRFQPEDDTARTKLRELYRKITQQDKAAEVWTRIRSEKQMKIEQFKEIAKTKPEAAEMSEAAPAETSPAPSATAAMLDIDQRKTELGATVSELEKLRIQAEERLRRAVEDRRERDKSKAGVPVAAPAPEPETEPVQEKAEQDIRVLLTQAQMYIYQNLLVEAMRLCQKILELDPQNKEVRGLLKQIYDKKNL